MMSLFTNPCEYPTYVNPLPLERPSRKKRFCKTNLGVGVMGSLGKLAPPPACVALLLIRTPFSALLSRSRAPIRSLGIARIPL